MILFNISKKIYRVGLFTLVALLLASCSWFNDDAIQPQPLPVIPQFNTFTISGKLTTNGAMPENYAQIMNSRTALATAPTGQTILHKVLLLANEGDATPITGATSNVTEDSVTHELSYTIKYTGTDTTAVRYWLRAVTYYMNGTDEVVILASPDTQLDTAVDLKGGVFTKDLEMRPVTSGYGEVELDITLASATMCDSITISDDTHFEISGSGTSRKIIHKAASAENSKVACGSYPVTVSFYKNQTINSTSTPVLVYQFEDIINVFNNLTTNKWVDNGNSPHLTTESGVTSCSITESKLAAFNATNFYVNKSFTGTEKGTFAEPFKSLQYAVQYIEAVGNETSTYTIHVKGVTDSVETFIDSQNITKKITIEVYNPSSAPGSKNGYYGISYEATTDSVFTVTNTGVLTFDSNGAAVGSYPVQGTKGITITSSYDGVSVFGKFIMKGGCIKGCSNIAVEIVNTGTVRIFEMTGGAISNNAGTGVYVPSNGNFMVSGKPYISGNTSTTNLKLDTGAVMTVTGPFVTGALIGVKTTTPPTIPQPVPITSGYGYQTGGYNAGVLPGTYFRGDVYGVTEDGDPDSGEAVLALSGGSITTAPVCDENVEITISKSFFTTEELRSYQSVSFTATTIQEGTRVEIPAADITYTSTLSHHGGALATGYYSSETSGIGLRGNNKAFGPGLYEICVKAVYGGNTYYAGFNVRVYDVAVPDGFKLVPGAKFTSSTTLCNDDSDRKSNVFIGGRNLTIPDLVVSDHEVTQKEYQDYMTWLGIPRGTNDKPSVLGDDYAATFVCWYDAIIYCNLKSLADHLTPAYYLADSAGDEVAGGRDVSAWDSNSLLKIDNYNGKFYYTATSFDSGLDYKPGGSDIDGGIRYDENADGWRLPTSVEWEYLARGGNLTDDDQYIYSGSDTLDTVAWHKNNSSNQIKAIKSKGEDSCNALGLYDMTGNAFEWCWDIHNGTINTSTPITGISTYDGSYPGRVTRGGSFSVNGYSYLPNNKNNLGDQPADHVYDQGFRIVRTVK